MAGRERLRKGPQEYHCAPMCMLASDIDVKREKGED